MGTALLPFEAMSTKISIVKTTVCWIFLHVKNHWQIQREYLTQHDDNSNTVTTVNKDFCYVSCTCVTVFSQIFLHHFPLISHFFPHDSLFFSFHFSARLSPFSYHLAVVFVQPFAAVVQ